MEKKLSKREQKKLQQYHERRRRLINDGVSEERVDDTIAQQDYLALPTGKKFERLEAMVAGAFRQISIDIDALRHNDMMIADAMDINMRSMSACLAKVGISVDEQKKIIEGVQAEMAEAHRKLVEEQKHKEEQAKLNEISKAVEEETSASESSSIPEGATVFGG